MTTGLFATLAGLFDLAKLAFEQRKEHALWSASEWARLMRGTGQAALAGTYGAVGGYAAYMYLAGRWDAARATSWFVRGASLVGWAMLLVEGLYLVWRHFTHRSEMQSFLEQCCWGTKRRWGDTAEDQGKEFQVLVNMLFTPGIEVDTTLVTRTPGSTRVGKSGLLLMPGRETSAIRFVLPGAEPETTRLGIKVAAVTSSGVVRDVTSAWEESVKSEWLPIQEGMGLKLTGRVAELSEGEHLEVRVLYYSPLAALGGAVDEATPVVGGKMGMRYLIKGGRITRHANHEGALPSDSLPVTKAISKEKLRPWNSA